MHDSGRELVFCADFIGVLKRISARNLKNIVFPSKNAVWLSKTTIFEKNNYVKNKFWTQSMQNSTKTHHSDMSGRSAGGRRRSAAVGGGRRAVGGRSAAVGGGRRPKLPRKSSFGSLGGRPGGEVEKAEARVCV